MSLDVCYFVPRITFKTFETVSTKIVLGERNVISDTLFYIFSRMFPVDFLFLFNWAYVGLGVLTQW